MSQRVISMDRLRIDEDPTRSTTKFSKMAPDRIPMPDDGFDYKWYLGCMWATDEQIASWDFGSRTMDQETRIRNNTARENTNPA